MGYNKIIKYAHTIETYEYSRDLPDRPPRQRRFSVKNGGVGVAPGGENPLQRHEYEGKRQDNARRAAMAFRRLVSANLGGVDHPLLLTLTYQDNQTSLSHGYKDFHAFIQTLRHQFGKQFRYIAVPEFQDRGAIHFHAMLWGLPETLAKTERHTRLVKGLWGHGFIDVIQSDGGPRLSSYLAKYMTKSFTDYRLMGQKSYTCSRNLLRPEIVGGISATAVDAALQELGAGEPEIDKSYDTMRLGTGRHRIYKI